MNRLHIAALWIVALFPFAAARAAAADDYAYAWPLAAGGTGAAWQVELTPEVYAAAHADLLDVAVVNAAGAAVPTARYRPPTAVATVANLVDVPVFMLPAAAPGAANDAIRLQIERGSDGRLRRVDADLHGSAEAAVAPAKPDLLLDASALHEALGAVRIDWNGGADVAARFEIGASDDLQQWRRVAAGTLVHLTRDGNALDRHEIALGGLRAAYLRVHRSDDGGALGDITVRLRTIASSDARRAARQWLPAATDGADASRIDPTLAANDARSVAAYRYRLPAALRVEALRIELADDNSLARIHVLSHAPGAPENAWTQRAELVAFRLRQDDSVIGNDEIAVTPAAPAADWRIESATPLDRAPRLSVAYVPDRIVFLAQGAGPYRLVAGSAQARRGEYPVDAALATLRASRGADWQPPLAALGARATLAGERALVAPQPGPDWKTWLLWAVLVAAAALIGGMALSLVRGEGRREKGEGNSKS